jgi:multiple sugar transport system substrate-binding protein
MGAAAVLAACAPVAQPTVAPEAPAKATEAPTTKPAAAEPVKLVFIFRSQEAEMKTVDAWNAAFSAKHPDIQVEALYVAFAESEPKLMSMYAAGDPPDIYGTTGTNPYAERYLRGMVKSLQPYLDAEGADLLKDAWPIAVNAFVIDGQMYSLAAFLHAAGTWVNATLFDEAGVDYPPVDWSTPWTWEQMIETAEKLTKDKNGDGKIDQFGVTEDHRTPWYLTRMWGQDTVSKEDTATGFCRKLQLDKKEVYDACLAGLEARRDLTWKQHVSPDPDESGPLSQLGPLLLTGAIGMQVAGPWVLWGELPEQFKFRGAVMPTGGVNGSGTTCKNVWAEPYQISSRSKHPDEAWQYIKWIGFDPEAVGIAMVWRNCMPVSKSGYDIWYKQYGNRLAMSEEESRTFWTGSLAQAETTVPDHLYAGWAKVRDFIDPEIGPGQKNEKPMNECLDAFIEKANKALVDVAKEMGIS